MNIGAFVRNAAGGDERKSIAAGMRRSSKNLATPDATHGDEQEWMVTYTDLVTLLLTLFVILISMSTFEDPGGALTEKLEVEETKAPDVAPLLESLLAFQKPDFGSSDTLEFESTAPGEPIDALVVTKWTDRVEALLVDYLSTTELAADIEIEKRDDVVVIHMRDQILFQSARTDLGDQGHAVLRMLTPVMSYLDVPVTVEGHTDNVPIRSGVFPSNWELSASRAATVVRTLIDEGIAPERLRAVGYADTRPQASNDSAAGRARNRRVSLVLSAAKDDLATPGAATSGATTSGAGARQ
ncbi:MAG: OmpA family protein [Alphaproteobacteria bacterium]|nr:OmpA family protein [Alphaproteobacteria bacterium]